jgi:hypothetical protein
MNVFIYRNQNVPASLSLYPALNMDEAVQREGLRILQDAIQHVSEHGRDLGDSPAWPTGLAGY